MEVTPENIYSRSNESETIENSNGKSVSDESTNECKFIADKVNLNNVMKKLEDTRSETYF